MQYIAQKKRWRTALKELIKLQIPKRPKTGSLLGKFVPHITLIEVLMVVTLNSKIRDRNGYLNIVVHGAKKIVMLQKNISCLTVNIKLNSFHR